MKKGSCLPNIFSQVIYSGGYSDGEPPLPIPNREAKPVIADGTARPGGRVGSCRAWKESSDERSFGDSFFVSAGVRGNAVRDIPVFWAQRKIPVDLHFIVRLLLRLEDVASVAPSIEVKILHLSTPPVHVGVAAACPCGRTLRSCSDVFPCGTAVRGLWTGVFVMVVPALCPRV